MTPPRALFAAAFAVLAHPLMAGDSQVVVELFTSQGCSSCPPADAVFRDLAQRDDVIALALHVDYWDYIGWEDVFADPDYAVRQRAYAAAAGRRMIYTPQMIVQGREDLVGVKTMELAELILKYRESDPTVGIDAARSGGEVVVQLSPLAQLSGPYDVQLVRYDPLRSSHITRGENAGHDFDYANVVTDWEVIGRWDGKAPATLHAPLKGAGPAVVLVQQAGAGPIAGAARLD